MKNRIRFRLQRTVAGLFIGVMAVFLVSVSGCHGKNGAEPEGSSLPEDPPAGSVFESETEDEAAAEPSRDENGYIMITDAASFELLRTYPNEKFHITEEIDFQGAEFTPIEGFSGVLTGDFGGVFHHTVSNITIKVGENAEHAGIFGVLTGTVVNLNFENVTIDLPDGFSGQAGILAGEVAFPKDTLIRSGTDRVPTVRGVRVTGSSITGRVSDAKIGLITGSAGRIADCFVSGDLSLEVESSGACLGTVAGSVSTMENVESEADLTITGETENLSAGGLAGLLSSAERVIFGGRLSVRVNDPNAAVGGLAGWVGWSDWMDEYAVCRVDTAYDSAKTMELIVNGETVDRPFSGNETDHLFTNAYRRDRSDLESQTMSLEEQRLRQTVVDYMLQEITIPWRAAIDMDYADGCDSGHVQHYEAGEWYFGLPYTHECGSLERFLYYLNDGQLSGEIKRIGWETVLGNDCADAIYWAWARVSPSVTYTLTDDMIVRNGTVQVGTYELANHDDTADTCRKNGIGVMLEAYACLRMGDALLKGPGHVRMAAEAPTVIRRPDGSIDPDASYVLCHEQGNVSQQAVRHSTCNVRQPYSFRHLFDQDYIPITIPELSEGTAGEWTYAIDNPKEGTLAGVFYGKIVSNYRIDSVRVIVTDRATGEEVVDHTYFPNKGDHVGELNLQPLRHRAELDKLKKGTYHYVLYLSTGAGTAAIEEFYFTK